MLPIRTAASHWRVTARPAYFALSKRFYKLSVLQVKKGQVVDYKNKSWRVLNRESSSSGRGGAVVKVLILHLLCSILMTAFRWICRSY